MRIPVLGSVSRRLARTSWLAGSTLSCFLLSITAAHAQLAAKIVAANGAGSDIYSVAFAGSSGTTTVLNTDANAHTGIRSLVFRPNADTGSIDLIAADSSRGDLLLYPNGLGNSQLIWRAGSPVANPLEGAGPARPDGLSLDGAGNVYVVSSSPGNNLPAELWVFPRNPFGPLPGGFGLPRLVDNDFGTSVLVETLSMRVVGNIAAGGSLLVLTSNPSRVLVYSAASLNAVLSGAGETDATTLVPSSQFPGDAGPGGMDIWPLDGSLLVTTFDRILRFSTTGRLPDFAIGLGNGAQNKFKIRTARIGTSAVAVVADNSNGRLLEFDASGSLVATITSGVNRPQALATTNAAATSATCYQTTAGCDLLGGVVKHRALNVPPQSASGFVLQEPCVVNIDPRYNPSTGTWTDSPLSIASVCPGFGTSVIPAYLRGGSGASGKGFAIVGSDSNYLLPLGAEVASEVYSENLLGSKPACNAPYSAEVVTWAPTAGEGTIVEGSNAQLDATVGCRNPLLAGTRGGSDWTFGLVLDTTSSALPGATTAQKLFNFSSGKYVNLLATVDAAPMKKQVKSSLVRCLNGSKGDFDRLNYAGAVAKLQTCDQDIRAAYANSPGDFQASASNPNPYGEIVTRIANLSYTIRFRQMQP